MLVTFANYSLGANSLSLRVRELTRVMLQGCAT